MTNEIKLLIRYFKEKGLYSEWVENIYNCSHKVNTIYNLNHYDNSIYIGITHHIYNFYWRETKQGYDFWDKVYKDFFNFINEFKYEKQLNRKL